MSSQEFETEESSFSEPYVAESTFEFPAREAWSSAAVKLLQGVVYHDDSGDVWNAILANISPLTDHFGRIGLALVVDEDDGLAWLRQPEKDQLPADYESIPRLFKRVPLGFEATLMCVVLRDELRKYEEEDFQNQRCVVKQSELLATWKMFFPDDVDEVRLNDVVTKQLSKLEKLKFVRRFERKPPSWEVRPIIKARMPLDSLKQTREALQQELDRRRETTQ